MQYEIGEGSCLSAWGTVTRRAEDTLTEARRPDWAAAAAATGVRSVLSAPLVYQGVEVGAVRVYATDQEAFTDYEEQLLSLLAGAAATLLETIQDSQSAHQLTAELKDAVAARQDVQQAVGLLMERYDLEAETAHARPLAAARVQHLSVSALSARLLHHADDPQV